MGLKEDFGMSDEEFTKAMMMAESGEAGGGMPMGAPPAPKPPTPQELNEAKARAASLNAYATQFTNLKVNSDIQKKLDDAQKRLGTAQAAHKGFKAALPVVKPVMSTSSKLLIGGVVVAAAGAGWLFLRKRKK